MSRPTDPPAEAAYYFAGFTPPYYTPVPDALFDELLPHLSGNEVKVLLYICRRTFGFKKDRDAISLGQLAEGITRRDGTRLDGGAGVSRAGAQAAIKGLLAKGCIVAERQHAADGGDAPTCYALRFAPGVPETSSGGIRNQHPARPMPDTAPYQELAPQDTAVQENSEQEDVPAVAALRRRNPPAEAFQAGTAPRRTRPPGD